MAEPILRLEHVTKSFDNTPVLRGIDLEVQPGEFITLLGSSGCGKTTTLRIIAGLETPDSGRVVLEGRDMTNVPPEKRDVNTVFQSYALFPHMTVAANIGYSLKIRRRPKAEIAQAVEEALHLVQLEGYGDRMPSELSGGQRQRVAIARAIVNRPRVLLLDEPLGALDLQLRRQMQVELKRLQKKLGITFIYITHDQEEALNMSDRIAVMRGGQFEQIGTPAEVYDRPKTDYVARFVGTANILHGVIEGAENHVLQVRAEGGCVPSLCCGCGKQPGDSVTLAVRSEHIEFCEEGGIPAVVREKSFAGGMLRIALTLGDGSELVASRHGIDIDLEPGQPVRITWRAECAVPVEEASE